MYLRGYGIKQNYERAIELLDESSRFGNPQGQRYLAEMYEKGLHLDKNHYLALRLSEKAVGRGAEKLKQSKLINPQFIIEAATIAGRMYCVFDKYEEGFKFFEQAAQMGDVDAQVNLGHMYDVGSLQSAFFYMI